MNIEFYFISIFILIVFVIAMILFLLERKLMKKARKIYVEEMNRILNTSPRIIKEHRTDPVRVQAQGSFDHFKLKYIDPKFIIAQKLAQEIHDTDAEGGLIDWEIWELPPESGRARTTMYRATILVFPAKDTKKWQNSQQQDGRSETP